MKERTIPQRLFLNAGLLCLIITVLSAFSAWRLYTVSTAAHRIVDDSLPGLIYSGAINQAMAHNIIRMQRLPQVSAAQRVQIEAEIATEAKQADEVIKKYEATIFEPEDRQNFEKFQNTLKAYREARIKFYSMVETNQTQAEEYLESTFLPLFNEFNKATDALFFYNTRSGDSDGRAIIVEVSQSTRFLIYSVVGSLLLAAALTAGNMWSLKRALAKISTTLRDGANQVTSASSQVSVSSQSLAEGASEQAASTEETSSSLEEMSSMTKRNAENAEKAKDLATSARNAADNGSADMVKLDTAMSAIKASSTEIAKIIKTIDEIAFQTNILALNAAVEAARAGEAGLGFAVVAEEVRHLAQRSAEAAKETAEKIETAITNTEHGVQISSKVASELREIVDKVRQVDTLVAEVASASHEQNQGIGQVNTAISQMDKVTQNNAASAEETASAAEELSAQASSLKEAIEELMYLAGTRQERVAPPMAATTIVDKPFAAAKPIGNGLSKQSLLKNPGTSKGKVIPLEDDFLSE